MAILAAGSQPLFCSLYEFKTACELEIKATEREIARELRSRGHTALSDDVMYPHNQGRYAWRYEIGKRWDFLEQVIGEYLDLVNEQARIVQWLRSF